MLLESARRWAWAGLAVVAASAPLSCSSVVYANLGNHDAGSGPEPGVPAVGGEGGTPGPVAACDAGAPSGDPSALVGTWSCTGQETSHTKMPTEETTQTINVTPTLQITSNGDGTVTVKDVVLPPFTGCPRTYVVAGLVETMACGQTCKFPNRDAVYTLGSGILNAGELTLHEADTYTGHAETSSDAAVTYPVPISGWDKIDYTCTKSP